MLKRELGEDFFIQPKRKDKKKRHGKGFSEDIQDRRAQRVSFKRYVREIEEQLEDEYDDYSL